jgi:hypothetical protein
VIAVPRVESCAANDDDAETATVLWLFARPILYAIVWLVSLLTALIRAQG